MRSCALVLACLLAACESSPPVAARPRAVTSANALTKNALTKNALTKNALTKNALTKNALTKNGLTSDGLLASALVEDPQARELLAYVYSCAMPAGATLDLTIDGTSYGTLSGDLGLAPEWACGPCDRSCQRWISACLLARTNFFGVTVPISLRGPHPALTASPDEVAEFPIKEAAFWGNLFAFEPSFGPYACAGPGSSLAALTARVCGHSDGAVFGPDSEPPDCGFSVLGSCEASLCGDGQCATVGADGAVSACAAPDLFGNPGERYQEVITVYLREPMAACGNGVCEETESTAGCPDDCPPGWALRAVNVHDSWPSSPRLAASAAGDVYVTGAFSEAMTLGITPIAAPGAWDAFVARLDAGGEVVWARRLGCSASSTAPGLPIQPMIALADDGGVLLALQAWGVTCAIGGTVLTSTPSASQDARDIFLVRLDPDGQPIWARHVAPPTDVYLSDLEVAPGGQILLAGAFHDQLMLGGATLTADGVCGGPRPCGMFVAAFAPDGASAWSFARPAAAFYVEVDVVADAAGAVHVSATRLAPPAARIHIEKRSPAGQLLWAGGVDGPDSLAWDFGSSAPIGLDPAGNLFVAFSVELDGTLDAGGGPIAGGAGDTTYLVKLDADGQHLWSRRVGGDARSFTPLALTATADGGFLLLGQNGGLGAGSGSGGADLGGGTLVVDPNAYHLALAKFGPSGGHLWSRVLATSPTFFFADTLEADANGNVLVRGQYDHYAIVDSRLLAAGDATTVCGSNAFVVSVRDEAGAERCNGLDDDGDGALDEGLSLGAPCDGPDEGERCLEGALACAGDGESVRCTDDTDAVVERCNGIDDDCDGAVDDGFPEVGELCDGTGGCEGVWACAQDGVSLVCEVPAVGCGGQDAPPNACEDPEGCGEAQSCEPPAGPEPGCGCLAGGRRAGPGASLVFLLALFLAGRAARRRWLAGTASSARRGRRSGPWPPWSA